ncbi:uncharacterized protein M6B38_367865 [Iris pallida]|uniref:Uncharacterized protein n=1 Tax=Iris pallida TaxID=29817 RepID=A0AAX6GEG6_IRIPA|nr:uncharacterized protein M6B38_367865 [Iris pallida]
MGTCSSVHKSNKPLVPSPRKQKAADGGGRQQQLVNMVATGLNLETSDLGSKREIFHSNTRKHSEQSAAASQHHLANAFQHSPGTPVLNLLQPVERNLLTSSKKPRNRSTYPSRK